MTTQKVDPAITGNPEQTGGFLGFLDDLSDVGKNYANKWIESEFDKQNDPVKTPVEDQTAVLSEHAKLNDETKTPWYKDLKFLGIGAAMLIGGVVLYKAVK